MSKFYKLNPLEIGSSIDGFIPEGYIEYTDEPQELLDALAVEKEAQDLQAKVQEAKSYLAGTDYKMLPNYVVKENEDINAIIAKRNEAREFIRNNKV